MGLRFQRRIKLFPGFTLVISKSGISFTLGGKGAGVNISKSGATGNVGIPGTGVSYRKILFKTESRYWFVVIGLILVSFFLVIVFVQM
jgi:Protein of unknown function (DUF4236)